MVPNHMVSARSLPTSRHPERSPGFSLIELLMAVGLAGIVRTNMSCIVAGVTANMAAGAVTAQVDSSNGFTVGMLAYLRHPSGSGQFLFVSALAATSITLSGAAT